MFAFVHRLDEKYNHFMDHNNSSYVTMFTFAYVGLFAFTKRLFTHCIFVLLASAAIIQCDAKQLESERYMN